MVASFITRIRLPDLDLELPAKLDTGAKSSSLHAERIVAFERKGRLWVRFRFAWGASPRIVIERPVIRIARIRRAGVGVRQRYVVRLRLCVAGKTAVTAFTLADRTGMRYAVLVGRRFLNGRILVASRRGSRGLKRC
ncbi:MAG: RimK/LysX family protein [Pseudomonadota bacterium]